MKRHVDLRSSDQLRGSFRSEVGVGLRGLPFGSSFSRLAGAVIGWVVFGYPFLR